MNRVLNWIKRGAPITEFIGGQLLAHIEGGVVDGRVHAMS